MLLDYYDQRNRVVEIGKSVTYNKEKIYGKWTFWVLLGIIQKTLNYTWKYTRTCTKSYKYVGMDYLTACDCVNAMNDYYQRTTMISEFQTDGNNAGEFIQMQGGSMIMAEIKMENIAGTKMYDVYINVNERDEKWNTESLIPSSMFLLENTREYDEE